MKAKNTITKATLSIDSAEPLQQGRAAWGALYRTDEKEFFFAEDHPDWPAARRSRRIFQRGKASLRLRANGCFRITMTIDPVADKDLLSGYCLSDMLEAALERMFVMIGKNTQKPN